MGFILGMQVWFNIQKLINIIRHINRIKKNHTMIPIDAKIALDKIQHSFMIKSFSQLGIKGKLLNLIKSIYKIPTGYIIFKGKRLNDFLLRLGTSQRYLVLLLFYNILLKVLATAIK